MPTWTERPLFAVPLLLLCAGLAVLPNLGQTSLWDDDEGRNAGCTYEMMEIGTWIIPRFNGELRTAKPVLLYWLMRPAFEAFGANEFAARLPSAVCFVLLVLAVYFVGRRMFGGSVGLLAGIVTSSTIGLVYLGRGCITDMPLILAVTLFFGAFWRLGVEGGRWLWAGIACGVCGGVAGLAKGPAVGVVLPLGAVGLWAAFRTIEALRAGEPWGRPLLKLALVWLPTFVLWLAITAGPWYGLVAAETKGEWPRAFFGKENVERATEAMEGHKGLPVVYELIVIVACFAPWCSFLAVSLWGGGKGLPRPEGDGTPPFGARQSSAHVLLLCWFAVVFLACAAAATKLPHYISPAYPALALLTARFLVRWAKGEITPPRWVLPAGLAGFALTGLIVAAGLLVAGGVIRVGSMRTFPGLERWAWVGALPLLAAGAGWWLWRKGNRPAVVSVLAAGAVLFVAGIGAFVPGEIDKQKAVKVLVAEGGARVLDREARVGGYAYNQPSITFYCGRAVERLPSDIAVRQFLAYDIESYLFIKESDWEQLKGEVKTPARVVAGPRYDFYHGCNVVVVTNR